jgi:hypothetical protein
VSSPTTPNAVATEPAAAPVAPAPVARAVPQRTATPRPAARGVATDYGYVISELQRIFLFTLVILVFLVGLYIVLG